MRARQAMAIGSFLLVCISAGVARAQDASQVEVAEEPTMPEEAPASRNLQEARTRVERGEALFERGDFDAALTEFETAYEVIGAHPNRYLILYNIGQCHEREFRYDVALDFYRRYLEEGGSAAEDRASVEERIGTLEGLLATVDVATNVGAAVVWIDEREVGTAPGEVRVPAGVHVIELRADGYLPSRREVQVAAGGSATVRVNLEKLSEEFQGLSPIFFWSTAGVAVAALATGLGFGIAAVNRHGDIQARLDDPTDRWNVTQEEIDSVNDLTITADVFYATAALFGLGAVVIGLLTDWDGDEEDDDATAIARLRPSVEVGPSAARLTLAGSF